MDGYDSIEICEDVKVTWSTAEQDYPFMLHDDVFDVEIKLTHDEAKELALFIIKHLLEQTVE